MQYQQSTGRTARRFTRSIDTSGLPDVNAPDYWDNAVLVWQDEFDGDTISKENWTFETGAHGWGNNELQNYIAEDNVRSK